MTVDMNAVGGCHPALMLMRRILRPNDAVWVHERSGADRMLIRKFRAQRRRAFYHCLRVLWDDARSVQAAWQAAAERSGDYSGADWPLEMARLSALMASAAVLAELQWIQVPIGSGPLDRLVDHLGSLKSLNPAMMPAN